MPDVRYGSKKLMEFQLLMKLNFIKHTILEMNGFTHSSAEHDIDFFVNTEASDSKNGNLNLSLEHPSYAIQTYTSQINLGIK